MLKTIWVVDDDTMNLRMAEFILKQQQYDVVKIESGLECLQLLGKQKPDLILLDVQMPIMSGIKTLEHIREKEETRDIPVVFLTASADTETVIDAGRLGVVDYVVKPFMPQELLSRVERVLNELV
ncbi:MAG: response regulator [Lachnospiraceae bacterium]|nr:response regulator [Lachnospiraceae bacterium]